MYVCMYKTILFKGKTNKITQPTSLSLTISWSSSRCFPNPSTMSKMQHNVCF